MPMTFHVRGEIDEVIESVVDQLETEGFALVEEDDEPPGDEAEVRRLVLVSENDWVSLADDPFTQTEWGAILAHDLVEPAITLEGDNDHAFYSRIVVNDENGASVFESTVPHDAVHESDGRHRIRPTFLAEIFPDAKDVLEAGIVIDKHGGPANMLAVGQVLGLPRPVLSIHDQDPGAKVLTFVYEGAEEEDDDDDDAASGAGPLNPFQQLQGQLGDMLNRAMAGESFDMNDLPKMMQNLSMDSLVADMAASFIPGGRSGGEPSLRERFVSSKEQGFEGHAWNFYASFSLDGGEKAKGIVITMSGDGLALYDPPELTAHLNDGRSFTAKAEKPNDRVRVFRFPDVELSHAEDPGLADLPEHERVRQSMKLMRSSLTQRDPAEVTIRGGTPKLEREGKGTFAIGAELLDPADLTASCQIELEVKPALVVPLLPSWAESDSLKHNLSYLETYASRDHYVVWLAFDTGWADVKDLAVSLAAEAEPLLLAATNNKSMSANVRRQGGETLEFPPPVSLSSSSTDPWPQIAKHLEEGADIQLSAGKIGTDGPSLEIVHQPNGSNFFPSEDKPLDERRPPRILVGWSCKRPSKPEHIIALADLASRAVERAAAHPSCVGALATAQGEPLRYVGTFETPYEHLADTRLATYDVHWLIKHAKAPAWRVFAPNATPSKAETPRTSSKKLAHGVLISSSAKDPFAFDQEDARAVEHAVLPFLGSSEELEATRP